MNVQNESRVTPPLPPGEGRGEGKRERKPLPSSLLENARTLRTQQTDAESLLWRLLRNRQIVGYKFRRQHPVGPYILDFYCHEKKLAIELDGGQHNTESGLANDQKRTQFLMSEGITVLRFWNHEVLQDKDAVLEQVYGVLEGTFTLTPALSQREREKNAASAEVDAEIEANLTEPGHGD
jgi:type I restriction enzyme M protein